jgi:hypothetical protein
MSKVWSRVQRIDLILCRECSKIGRNREAIAGTHLLEHRYYMQEDKQLEVQVLSAIGYDHGECHAVEIRGKAHELGANVGLTTSSSSSITPNFLNNHYEQCKTS